MKTIEQIKETWDAAPTLRDKDVLVSKAVYGWEGMLVCPECGAEIKSYCNDDVYCTKCNFRGRYSDGNYRAKEYTTDPAAALRAMEQVGIKKWTIEKHAPKKYSFFIWDWWHHKYPSMVHLCVEMNDLRHETFPLACAFAAYTFSELKEGAE